MSSTLSISAFIRPTPLDACSILPTGKVQCKNPTLQPARVIIMICFATELAGIPIIPSLFISGLMLQLSHFQVRREHIGVLATCNPSYLVTHVEGKQEISLLLQ